MKSAKVVWALVATVAVAGSSYFGTAAFTHMSARADSPAATARPTPEPQPETVAPVTDLSRAFRAVHTAMKDAVVNIRVTKKMGGTVGRAHPSFQLPPGFKFPPGFNPDDLNQDPPDEGGQGGEMMGTGSGVIVSPDGYVLTNNHVVEGEDEINVRLDDGRNLKAKVVGTDPKTDLAVVKIDADHLTYAKFGDSDAIEVGDWVLAFGSPFGFDQTMTQGIISAKGRQINIIGSHNPRLAGLTYENFLQTDAAVNPGNSGGPLVNLRGEVVGINSAIASNTGAYNGIGFSIPSNDARAIMDSLIKHGKVVRGYLGVLIGDVRTAEDPQTQGLVAQAKKAGFTGDRGALISGISPDSPGEKGGLKLGDIVVAIDGKPVESMNALRNQIAHTAPGTNVKLTVFRDGKTVDLDFPVGTQPDVNSSVAFGGDQNGTAPESATNNDLGIKVETLDANLARKYKLRATHGVVVAEIDNAGPAAQTGLNVGDAITSVNGTPVISTQEFADAMSKVKLSDGVRLTVRTLQGMDRLIYIEKK